MGESTEHPPAVAISEQPQDALVDQPQPAPGGEETHEELEPPVGQHTPFDLDAMVNQPQPAPEVSAGLTPKQLNEIREGLQQYQHGASPIADSQPAIPVPSLNHEPSTGQGLADFAHLANVIKESPEQEVAPTGNFLMNFLKKLFNLFRRRTDLPQK